MFPHNAVKILIALVVWLAMPTSVLASVVPDYSLMFPHVFARHGPPLKRIALTFDDGPDTRYTPQILSILQKEHVHATFFVLGVQAVQHPRMIKRIYREGHVIGNHSFDHANLIHVSAQRLNWEITATDDVLNHLIGTHTRLFRAPYGNVNVTILRRLGQLGYQAINWSVDSNDWRNLSAAQVEMNILKDVHPGAIILQHCAGNSKEILIGTVQALPSVIHNLRAEGYAFVTVPELFSPDTWAVHAPQQHHPLRSHAKAGMTK